MLFLRSVLLNLVFVSSAIIGLVGALPLLFLPRKWLVSAVVWGTKVIFAYTKLIVGIDYKVKGKIPQKPVIIASMHQSFWDTVIFHNLVGDPIYILKSQLMAVPLVGWFLRKLDMIPVKRSGSNRQMIEQLILDARNSLDQGHKLVIFPEGTRVAYGKRGVIKKGIGILYENLDYDVVPVTLNSGKFWPRRGFYKYPGTIEIEFHKPIKPGKSREELIENLETIFYKN